MRLRWSISTAVLSFGLALPAWAGLCQAPFMHDGGQTQLVGSGAMQLGADLAFSDVSKQGANDCQARVRGVARFGLAGLPPGKSSLDYFMVVRNGHASFERTDDQGQRVPVKGKFDLRMLGLFAYGDSSLREGQTFPALRFQIDLDKKAVDTKPIVVHTTAKTVGARQVIQTSAGEQSCWPINYTRRTEATQASFSGLVLPIPATDSEVTDWFCSDLHMVMKQESRQNGIASQVEVTRLQ
ncbi:hypothetical protein H0A70_03090 [Alcaligenaceae bacterium]|nr:hypothetical protein [Alcaligenaceae bacterium]